MMENGMNQDLSKGIISFVGWGTGATLPGRHPERIEDPHLKHQVLAVISQADEEKPGDQDLWVWAAWVGEKLSSTHPEISQDAIEAIIALITFEWR